MHLSLLAPPCNQEPLSFPPTQLLHGMKLTSPSQIKMLPMSRVTRGSQGLFLMESQSLKGPKERPKEATNKNKLDTLSFEKYLYTCCARRSSAYCYHYRTPEQQTSCGSDWLKTKCRKSFIGSRASASKPYITKKNAKCQI